MDTSLSIIGRGKVGSAIAELATRNGIDTKLFPARAFPADTQLSGVVILAVPDLHIAEFCGTLLAREALAPGAIVAHCSGVLTSEVLGAAQERGCHIGSIHPLQSFPTVERAVADLPRAFCFVEGDPAAIDALLRIGKRVTRDALRISTEHKVLYHSAAVFACNYLVTLMDAALATARAAGIEERSAAMAFLPLIESTVANVRKLGPAGALTGPIARGDEKTVAAHLAALGERSPELRALYRELGRATARLAERKPGVSTHGLARVREILD